MSVVLKSHHSLSRSSPQIADIPNTSGRRLIDTGLLHYEASATGYSERYRRGETSHTLHVWWARRPHSAMRILSFASLCKDTKQETLDIMKDLPFSTTAITKARSVITHQYSQGAKVLDMFGGGGTIPFEIANMGARAYSIDANELSVFIQKCNLVYSQHVDQLKIQNLVKDSGRRVLNTLAKRTKLLFPLREKASKDNLFSSTISSDEAPFGYMWTYSIKCPECNYKSYLSKRPWLSKKNGDYIALIFENGKNGQTFHIRHVNKNYDYKSNWVGKNRKVQCPKCKKIIEKINIHKCRDELVGIIKSKKSNGKKFIVANSKIPAIPPFQQLTKMEQDILAEMKTEIPKDSLPKWSGIVNPSLYGIDSYGDFLNPRQRLVLLTLIKCLLDEYNYLKQHEPINTARFIISLLSTFIDQLIDWNCRLSMWISQNEQIGRAFCGPGISMLWDYVEFDPAYNGPANLWSKLDRILSGLTSIPKFKYEPIVKHAFAQKLPFSDNFFDAIITDPPYYDNLYYSVLADFFYVWKRILLQHIEPDLFSNKTTDFSHELVASTFRNKTSEAAHKEYCKQLSLAIKEASRVVKPEGNLSFIYSHSSFLGWEAFLKSFRHSDFIITSVQPLSIERKHRPRGMDSEAVNTCIVFVAHKSKSPKFAGSIKSIIKKISLICIDYATVLKKAGWHTADIALSIFAHGVGYLCNYSQINDVNSDEEALKIVEQEVSKYFEDFKLKNRHSL